MVLFASIHYHLVKRARQRERGELAAEKDLRDPGGVDGEAGEWWCSNEELPLTTEAPTL
jgi:hypothetical protein